MMLCGAQGTFQKSGIEWTFDVRVTSHQLKGKVAVERFCFTFSRQSIFCGNVDAPPPPRLYPN